MPPVHAYFADPFVLDVAGDVVEVVFECYNRFKRKADIQLLSVDFRARTAHRVPLISESHHLSYPFVVRRGGAVYVLPESCGAAVQKVYRLGHDGIKRVAHPVCTIPGRYVDPTVSTLSPDGTGMLRYYTGTSNHDGELRECPVRFTGEGVKLDAESRTVGTHRPGGWWDGHIYPVQQAGTRYGFGLAFTDASDTLLPPPAALPGPIMADLGRIHHLSRHDEAMAFDMCADVGVTTLLSASHFFEVER
jgi:hypothetical protein